MELSSTKAREQKWQNAWKTAKAFEPQVQAGKPKFFCTVPYPYVNGRPHVGHLFTSMRTEAMARYQRMLGKAVLFPQGWHCTGQPIVAAAQLVARGDAKQIEILRENGVADEDIVKFENPVHWIEYFPACYRLDWENLGMSIDWRREFITTNLNPRYDAFIRWQMTRLHEKELIKRGKHAVVWDPVGLMAVGDHDRREGEGETPQEYTLITFPIVENNKIKAHDTNSEDSLVIATLRPETLDGATNIWVNPALTYVRVHVTAQGLDAVWIVSEPCAKKLPEQEYKVKVLGTIDGKELVGKHIATPDGRNIPVLPATFPTADKGSGIVLSVPSDAPDDYVALRDLQTEQAAAKANIPFSLVQHIKPIPIIDAGELGHFAAVSAVEQFKIVNQREKDKLEQAKKLAYKKGFYEGVMLIGPYAGEKVETAKEKLKRDLLTTGQAYKFYELTGKVVTRTLVDCTVRVVSDQWFIDYGDPAWKELAHKAVSQMRFYPEKSRTQFEHVIDWLREWACTRSTGLGTHLPWEERWLVESLSDSTFYNAYYTIAHILNTYPEKQIKPELFDYVFLGNGKPHDASWTEMRASFQYWYPVDFRNSGKDLLQNHLAFMLFTHVALFPEDSYPDKPEGYWPKAYGVNGFVTVDGKKMSKSLGNVIPVRSMIDIYGADASRMTMLNGGEGMDDPNWDSELAKTTVIRLDQLMELCREHAHDNARHRHDHLPVDDWFASVVHRTIRSATEAMDGANFRTAIQIGWFELGNAIKQYRKLSGENPHAALLRFALEAQLKLIQPFAPHAAAEGWEILGNKTMLCHEPWPNADQNLINPALEATQELIEQLASDIRSVATLLKKERVQHVTIMVAQEWLYPFTTKLRAQLRESRDVRVLLPQLLKGREAHAAEITKMVPNLVRDMGKLPRADTTQAQELAAVRGAAEYLGKQFGATIVVERAEESAEVKAKHAFPGKPALLIQ